jgi:hypothetical protein
MVQINLTMNQGDVLNIAFTSPTRPTTTTLPDTPPMSPETSTIADTTPATALPTTLPDTPPMSLETSTLADIWEDEAGGHATEEVLSEMPSMKRQHMTDGYREGLSTSKSKVMQAGFDEGYPIGVQIAMRAGPIFGVLEAYLACKSIDAIPGIREKVQAAYKDAVRELDVGYILQTTDEEVLASLKTIPLSAQAALQYWEGKVSAVYETRQKSIAIHERDNPHALREMVEAAKMNDPVKFDTDHTDKVSLAPVVREEGNEENRYRRKGRKPQW